MLSEHMLDQARAAAAHGGRFRDQASIAGRFLAVTSGPIDTAACAWNQIPVRDWLTCEHLPPTAPPQPLFGRLDRPGELLCAHCAVDTAHDLTPVCHGCGATIDPDDLGNRDVVIGLDNFVSLVGVACVDCRAQCEPEPTTPHGHHLPPPPGVNTVGGGR